MKGVEEQLKEMKNDGRSCILVGVQIDANGRELLDWALSKIAKKGDRIVAVHVCRDSGIHRVNDLVILVFVWLVIYDSFCRPFEYYDAFFDQTNR